MANVERTPDGNKHTERCSNTECPCYREGYEQAMQDARDEADLLTDPE